MRPTHPDDGGPTVGPVSLSGSPLVRHRYAVLAVLVTVLTTVQTVNGQWSSDMWEHVAVVRELIARPFDPSHPQVLSDATHPGFSPYTVTLGLLGHAFDIDAVTLLSLAAVLNVVLVLVTLRLLVLEATANEGPTIKRWRPRAQGRAFPIHKRMTHVTIVVENKEA